MSDSREYYFCPILLECPHWLDKCVHGGCQHPEAVEMRAEAQKLIIGREAGDLAAIKAKLAAAREAIARGDAEVEWGSFVIGQLGLSMAVCDKAGRIWRVDGTKLVLVYKPELRNDV